MAAAARQSARLARRARGRAVDDLSEGIGGLPPTDGLRYRLAEGGRVVVRPSGTEPKLKCYLEVVVPVDADVEHGRRRRPDRRRTPARRASAPTSPRPPACEPAVASLRAAKLTAERDRE